MRHLESTYKHLATSTPSGSHACRSIVLPAPAGAGSHRTTLTKIDIGVWDETDHKEIQARIDEMPERCAWLVNIGGKGTKSDLW